MSFNFVNKNLFGFIRLLLVAKTIFYKRSSESELFLSLSVVYQSIALISPQMIFSLSHFLPIFFCLLFLQLWGVKFNNILISITFCFTIRLMLWHPMSLGRWGELQYLYNWGLDEGACNSMVSPQWADSVCHQFHQLQHCVHCHCWWGGVSTSLVLSHHPCHPPSPHISWN